MNMVDMNFAQALHVAARRYCQDRMALWAEKKTDVAAQLNEARSISSRTGILRAIRTDLERLDPNDLLELSHVRNAILTIGMQSFDESNRKPGSANAASAITAERNAFCNYINTLTGPQLRSVRPLPYRRVLSENEFKAISEKVRQRWQIDENYWYPLKDSAMPILAAFQDSYFREFCNELEMPKFLSKLGIARIWELREFEESFELDTSEFDPCYNGAEGYWTSEKLDWIVYASHESSITVGGWLLQVVKDNWSQWRQHLWTSPYFS